MVIRPRHQRSDQIQVKGWAKGLDYRGVRPHHWQVNRDILWQPVHLHANPSASRCPESLTLSERQELVI